MATPRHIAFLREVLALVRLGESGGKVGIELYNFISAIVGPKADGTARRGPNIWTNAKRHYETLVDKPCAWPDTFKGGVPGCRDQVVLFDVADLDAVLRCVVPSVRARSLFTNSDFVEALRAFLRERNVSTEALEAYLRDLQSEMAEVAGAFGAHRIRTTRMLEVTPDLLVACDDILAAIGVRDPRHDWEHWLGAAVEGIAGQGSKVCLDSGVLQTPVNPLEKTPLLLRKKLEGSSNAIRVINYAMYRKIIDCYASKGKLCVEHISAALELYDRFKVGDARLADEILENAETTSPEAREFVLGTNSAICGRDAATSATFRPGSEEMPLVRSSRKRAGRALGEMQSPTSPKKINVAKWVEGQMRRDELRGRDAQFAQTSHLIYEVCKKFAELHAIDEGTDDKDAWKRLALGAFGQKAVVAEDRLPLLQAALHFVLGYSDAMTPSGEGKSGKRRRDESERGYRCDANSPHSLAKDRANDLFATYLLEAIAEASEAASKSPQNVGYLDAFESDAGFDLRSTRKLVASRSLRLYSANRDGGVVRALRSNGVQAYEGEWRDAAQAWRNEGLRFRGFFLDFCNASAEYLLEEIRRVEPLLDRPAIVAWTLPARDFGASPFSTRITQIAVELASKGWRLAGGNARNSCLEYASSGNQRMAMQCWRAP